MKTIVNLKKQDLCGRDFSLSRLLLPQWWLTCSQRVQKIWNTSVQIAHHPVSVPQVIPVIRAVLVSSTTLTARHFTGLALVGVMAPLSKTMYRFFDPKAHIEGWEYQINHFYLFYNLGPSLFQAFLILGFYLMFEKANKFKIWAFIPLGSVIGGIIQNLMATNNTEYHSWGMWQVHISSFLLALTLLKTVDYILWLFNHRELAYKKRLQGLLSHPNLDSDTKVKYCQQTFNEYNKFRESI